MNRGGLAGTVVRDRRPVHRLRRRRDRADGLRGRQDAAAASTPTTRPPSRTLEACAQAVSDLAAHAADGDGRAVHLAPGRRPGAQRPDRRGRDPLDRRRRRARRDLGVHLAQGAGRRGHGAGDGGDHAARAAARRRGRRRPGRRVRRAGRRRCSCRPCRAWWSAARCSTRPTTTSPARSTRPWACCEASTGMDEKLDLRARSAGDGAFDAGGHAGARRLGATAGCGSLELPPGAARTLDTGDDEMLVLPLAGSARRDLRRRDGSSCTGAATCSPGSPTSPTCPATRRSTVTSARRRPVRPARRAVPSGACRPRYGAAEDVPVELRGAGPGQPPGQQLLHARGVRGRPADRRRGAHPGRQLVVLPAAQARRGRATASRELEEIYYFEVATAGGRARPTSGSTARRTGRSTCWPRCAPATSC